MKDSFQGTYCYLFILISKILVWQVWSTDQHLGTLYLMHLSLFRDRALKLSQMERNQIKF